MRTNADGVRLAALVNDFGTINVDAKLIVSVEGDTVSLANSCVCCTIRDDLLIEVEKLLATEGGQPERGEVSSWVRTRTIP